MQNLCLLSTHRQTGSRRVCVLIVGHGFFLPSTASSCDRLSFPDRKIDASRLLKFWLGIHCWLLIESVAAGDSCQKVHLIDSESGDPDSLHPLPHTEQ